MIDSYEIHFNKDAQQVDKNQFKNFIDALKEKRYTDIIILAHGWNNDFDDARKLFTGLLEKISNSVSAKQDNSKRFASLNIFWPSKKFTDKELISGGAASLDDSDDEQVENLVDKWVKMQEIVAEELTKPLFDKILVGIRQGQNEDELAPAFHKILTALMASEEESELLENLPVDKVKAFLSDGTIPYLQTESDSGGATSAEPEQNQGNALGFFSGIKQGIANLMNVTTYYKMKARAGEIGSALNLLLFNILEIDKTINLHLIGHSFGARLVTSAVLGPTNIEVKTLALLQAAFSHYAFAEKYDNINDGFFRKVVTEEKVKGALFITHTRADRAVSLAYALASRLAGQTGNDIGDEDSLYGGLGGNGAQKMPGINKTLSLAAAASTSRFQNGKTYNLLSDGIIGNHSDIVKTEVGDTLANAFFLS